jgi:thiamine biosynthesis lipoprotein
MDTPVTISAPPEAAAAVDRAYEWFRRVEASCTRFNPDSELMRLTQKTGEEVPVTPLLFEAVQFAVRVADASGGAFDPTVGHVMETSGFNREYSSGTIVNTAIAGDPRATFRDVVIDPQQRTITLRCPLILDLGAVAKGLAIDLAARELAAFRSFAIDAGGDLFLGGCRPDGQPWSVGVRHPRPPGGGSALIDTLWASDVAVCTSGDYERGTHIVDPRAGTPAAALASATVIAPTAMAADAIATAAFVLGPDEGLRLCETLGVDALLVSPSCERFETRGMRSGQYRNRQVLSDTQRLADDRPGGVRSAGGAV